MMKSKRATRTAKKRLSKANSYLKEGKDEQFYDETLKALWGYLSDKLSMPVDELSKDAVRESLNSRSVSEDTINQFISILDHCEFAQYAAPPPDPLPKGKGESLHTGTPARRAGEKVLPPAGGEDFPPEADQPPAEGGAGMEEVYANGLQIISDIEHEIR